MADARESIDDELTTSQAAGILGVSDATVHTYRDNGWLTPVRRVGRSWLYRRADVDALHRKLHPLESPPASPRRG